MLTRRIIPCLDVLGGRVVKGLKFVHLRDAGDPVELAAFYDREGADELVFLRIGASVEGLETVAWAQRAVDLGAGEILLTSIDQDGTQDGYELRLTRAVSDAVPVPVIASGGAGTSEHIRQVLTGGGADAALLAGTLHRGQL